MFDCLVNTQACCQDAQSTAACCTTNGTSVFDTGTVNRNETCPCQSCWEKVSGYVDKAVKMAGGFGLFFSFTEVNKSAFISLILLPLTSRITAQQYFETFQNMELH